MRIGLGFTSVLLVCAVLTGCGTEANKCGDQVLALLPNSNGEYSFQEIRLESLKNPYSLSGGAAKVYYQNLLTGDGGFTGPVAEPHYTKSGNVCVPMDAASSMAVSVYAQFEALLNFEKKLGVSDMLTWPRQVGVDINLTAGEGVLHNNAHYFGETDSIAVLPYNSRGVPLGLNPGVMAHEHFHAHFQKQVMSAMAARLPRHLNATPESFFYMGFGIGYTSPYGDRKPTPDVYNPYSVTNPRNLNYFVLRGWNEGLADVYGAIFSENPLFFEKSLRLSKGSRSLEAAMGKMMNRDTLVENAKQVRKAMDLTEVSYDQGSLLARMMYAVSKANPQGQAEFLVGMLRKLANIPSAILPEYETKVLNFEDVIPVLMRDVPMNKSVCAALRTTTSTEMMNRSFTSCSGI